MNATIFRPLALGLLCVSILSCSTNDVVTPTPSGSARTEAGMLNYDCDVNQGFNFKQDQRTTFGYITSLSLGSTQIDPGLKVVDPNYMPEPPKSTSASSGTTTSEDNTRKQPVVSVLTGASWSTSATENIAFSGRISAATAQALKTLLSQSSTKRLVVAIGFAVYRFDYVNNAYFPTFSSFKGSAPTGSISAASPGGFKDATIKPIYGLIAKNSAGVWPVTIGAQPEVDAAGNQSYSLELTLAPTSTPAVQEIQIQTSATSKLIKPWGLSQQ